MIVWDIVYILYLLCNIEKTASNGENQQNLQKSRIKLLTEWLGCCIILQEQKLLPFVLHRRALNGFAD